MYPHNSNPRPASAAALLKQELAATSAPGAFDADSSGSDATAEQWSNQNPIRSFRCFCICAGKPAGRLNKEA